jgi:hypothetical protein
MLLSCRVKSTEANVGAVELELKGKSRCVSTMF